MEEKPCQPCDQEVIQKYPACPLQCMSPKCKAYKEPPIDSSKTPIVWVLGAPSSGKGTQCQKIIGKYGFTHLCTGDLLRVEVRSGSERAKCLATIMERGEVLPNDVVLDLLKEAMIGLAGSATGFLIDDYPREKIQGIAFEKAIAPVSVVIYLEASSETLIKRSVGSGAESGTSDGREETIKLRLKKYYEKTNPVLIQYREKLVRINAEESIDAIFNEIVQILDPLVI